MPIASSATASAIIAPMEASLDLTIVYEPVDDNGWIVASVPEVNGVHSQGRTRDEARAMVLSALGDWLRLTIDDQRGGAENDVPAHADTEPIQLTLAT